MIFIRDAHEPIYNSLHNLKPNKTINEWFNLAVDDETQQDSPVVFLLATFPFQTF